MRVVVHDPVEQVDRGRHHVLVVRLIHDAW